MHNSSTMRYISKVKTLADIDMRTSGMYSGNNYLNRHNQRKSPMKENRYYSIDDRSITRKAEDTTKERSSIQRLKKIGKIEEKHEIDLFAKRPSQLESSIYSLEQRIKELEGKRLRFAELLSQQTNQKIISVFIRTYEKIQEELDQLGKELRTNKDKKLNAVRRNDAENE